MFVAPSAYQLSGLATWLDYLEPGLAGLGWKVSVGLVQGPRHHLPHSYLERHPHSRWRAIECATGTPEGRARAIERAVAVVQPDVVASVNIPDAIVGTARARRRMAVHPKIAMTLHGIQPDLYADVQRYAAWIDRALCTNRLACRLVRQRAGILEDRIGYAPCGVELGEPRRAPHEAGKLRIAFVGRLEQDQKRVGDLPEIARQLGELCVPFELLIAGSGPEEQGLRQALKPAVDAGRARFLGFLTPQQLEAQVLSQVDVLLLTSAWETGPQVIWEAMANGVAVVSSRYVGSGLEGGLVHEGNTLLFAPGDCAAAAAQLRRVWTHQALRQQLVEAGQALVQTRYSIPVSVAHWSRELQATCESEALPAAPPVPVGGASSRLDRLLGSLMAETVREWMGKKGPDGGPGGEWPHAHSSLACDDPQFWAEAAALDAPNQGAAPS
ncbi:MULTISPECIES: glycosyltransferase family 4 protein [Aphanothece]|uniref:glycosyltransferase family 4 protein n=1 Tax=Aphanothece TaxID=1121 RepID=UPI00398532DC